MDLAAAATAAATPLPPKPATAHRPRARPSTAAPSLSPVPAASRAQKAAEREKKKEERAAKAAMPKRPKSGYLLYSGPACSKCPRRGPLRSAVARRLRLPRLVCRPAPTERPACSAAARRGHTSSRSLRCDSRWRAARRVATPRARVAPPHRRGPLPQLVSVVAW